MTASAPSTALVVTTISPVNAVLRSLAEGAEKHGLDFVVVGDTKSPDDFELDHCDYYGIAAQRELGLGFADACPTRHYARKNIGYLVAIRKGARVIIETDDDNIPTDAFFQPLPRETQAAELTGTGWCNVYDYYLSQGSCWPRGLPLDAVMGTAPDLPALGKVTAPIQQGLADENPDVDAIFRLTRPLPIHFDKDEKRVALGNGSWCPYNSQNTVHYAEAFPLLYLPAHCSFRMTDIWRSFVAQRIAWTCGWSILFREATVRQDRNEHDLMRDFADEIPGYLNNRAIGAALDALDLEAGVAAIPENMRRCYRQLVADGHVGEAELPLLDAWLTDLETLGILASA